jgi:hypothetical protein
MVYCPLSSHCKGQGILNQIPAPRPPDPFLSSSELSLFLTIALKLLVLLSLYPLFFFSFLLPYYLLSLLLLCFIILLYASSTIHNTRVGRFPCPFRPPFPVRRAVMAARSISPPNDGVPTTVMYLSFSR